MGHTAAGLFTLSSYIYGIAKTIQMFLNFQEPSKVLAHKNRNIFLLYGLTVAKQQLTKQEVNTETFKCQFFFFSSRHLKFYLEGWHYFNSLSLFKN